MLVLHVFSLVAIASASQNVWDVDTGGLLRSSALPQDDECSEETAEQHSACAVNALQGRGTSLSGTHGENTEIVTTFGTNAKEEKSRGRTCSHFKITGKVQMVHYRLFVLSKAKLYNVKGWVANGGGRTIDGQHVACPTCGVVLGYAEGSSSEVSTFLCQICNARTKGSAEFGAGQATGCKVESSRCYGCKRFYKEYKFCRTWEASHCKRGC
eukprot:TRINITY_DN107104_c0_g1_i1.p1 TRINITY_DN107104_c0_g1~~TRINITY_DN107104_c0_g1_i1.p1  ORF type:complete len:212 (+),score=23.63 TRINITY_DN107104_c0_g1_i1:52-687(+)